MPTVDGTGVNLRPPYPGSAIPTPGSIYLIAGAINGQPGVLKDLNRAARILDKMEQSRDPETRKLAQSFRKALNFARWRVRRLRVPVISRTDCSGKITVRTDLNWRCPAFVTNCPGRDAPVTSARLWRGPNRGLIEFDHQLGESSSVSQKCDRLPVCGTVGGVFGLWYVFCY